jgi:hypothetical protein
MTTQIVGFLCVGLVAAALLEFAALSEISR